MPLPDLLAALERDVRAEIAERTAAADRAVEQVHAQAALEADRVRANLLAAAEASAAAQSDQVLRAARADAVAAWRAAEATAWEHYADAMREQLAAAREDEHYVSDILAPLLDEALSVLTPATLRIDPRDAAAVTSLLAARGLAPQVDPVLTTWGGVQVDDGMGRLVHNTLEDRLDAAEPELRALLARAAAALAPDAVSSRS